MDVDQTDLKPEGKQTKEETSPMIDRIAKSLRSYGIKLGDVICICLPDIPEREVAKNVCKKLGAIKILFGVEELTESLLVESLKAESARVLIITDWCSINGRLTPSKSIADRASLMTPALDLIVVVRHLDRSVSWLDGRDVWWDTLLSNET